MMTVIVAVIIIMMVMIIMMIVVLHSLAVYSVCRELSPASLLT